MSFCFNGHLHEVKGSHACITLFDSGGNKSTAHVSAHLFADKVIKPGESFTCTIEGDDIVISPKSQEKEDEILAQRLKKLLKDNYDESKD